MAVPSLETIVDPLTQQNETSAVSSRRARELYKYFIPPEKRSATQSSAPDTTLAAQAQLVAWRLNTRRAMISLIDRDTQYFVAESSKTLNLEDSSEAEDPLDALWAGCVSVEKAGRLCEHTIKAPIPADGGPAYFEICNLAQDPRFNALPFISGDPHFRYYCGVPLRTKLGVNIGSLFALDDRVREPLGIKQLEFLTTIASNCMAHLEALKEKEDLVRIQSMNRCLAAFVDPDNRVGWSRDAAAKSPAAPKTPKAYASSMHKSPTSASFTEKGSLKKRSSMRDDTSVHSSASTQRTNRSKLSSRKEQGDEYMSTFSLAAALLARSLELNGQSGVICLDTGSSLQQVSQEDSSADTSESETSQNRPTRLSKRTGTAVTQVSFRSGIAPLQSTPQRAPDKLKQQPSEILSSSTVASEMGPALSTELDFVVLSQAALAKMIKRHPRGMLFNIDDEDAASSSSGEDVGRFYPLPKRRTAATTENELALLKLHFPGARQIIFVPFWNPSWSRFSACFAVNTSPFRDFQKDPDFLHAIAFCNCATIELTRIATLSADQQKSDFIGSISHELRSPLHGILASCEFLDDTELSTFQKSLVDTADSCARTLLDTINMVLDYSKINAFERNMSKSRRRRQQDFSTSHLQPALNITGDVDLAAITEEVVEGVATGQVFKDRLADMDAASAQQTSVNDAGNAKSSVPSPESGVEIILDIPPGNWMFLTQPGAFRRVVMNVFGNSLKYTAKGYIRIALHLEPVLSQVAAGDADDVQIVTLTIKDTGQGISPQYMKTKLFTPFAQESTIAPGTGLGLSLVRSSKFSGLALCHLCIGKALTIVVVRMLNGEIDIKSTVNVGTEVTIKFPMVMSRAAGGRSGQQSSSEATSSASIERARDDSLKVVAQRAKGKTALYYRPASSAAVTEVGSLTQQAISRYFSEWYNFELIHPAKDTRIPDIILVAQADLAALLNAVPRSIRQSDTTTVVVIAPSSNSKLDRNNFGFKNAETISYPFGPYKLAKVIRICLDNADRALATAPAAALAEDASRDELVEVMQSVDQVTIGSRLKVVQQGQMMANEEFAPLMMEAMSASSSRSMEQSSGFPFPAVVPSESADVTTTTPYVTPQKSTRIEKSMPSSPITYHHPSPTPTPTQAPSRVKTPQQPRLLLVDDNKVNLRLLQTFMQKRGYKDMRTAEDGAQSVEVYKSMALTDPPRPPDIIFMDISMPVMNGFEATRRIREIESSMRESLSPMDTPATSMIIALTGLASSRDQSEAFTSGFDLYLVKPISFKSVAKLLDSWEKNGGAATVGVPHGSLSGEDVAAGTTSKLR